MKTTGVLPEAFAASISPLSRSEMDAMPNSSRSQWKVIMLVVVLRISLDRGLSVKWPPCDFRSQRADANAARSSSEKSCGSSHAAK
jgi:hypothetical protein